LPVVEFYHKSGEMARLKLRQSKNILLLFRYCYGILLTTVGAFGVTGCDLFQPAGEATGASATLEVALFEGGYGIGWHSDAAALWSTQQPSGGVGAVVWGDPRVREKLKPRFLRGNPPDLMQAPYMPIWLLVTGGKLETFNDVLAMPGYGGAGSWEEQFVPGTLDTYRTDGKVYGIPSAFGAWTCWYDARLFREHGWLPPATWEEFMALCGAIESAGIAPLAFQGKYPVYAWWTLVTLIQRCGGLEAINRINALEPGAFQHPDVVRAAGLLQDMARRYFQPGALSMTHTESQLQFVTGKAAMVFCGLWLYNEMRSNVPETFEMRCFNLPSVAGGKGNPKLFNGFGTEYFFVPSEGDHPEAAKDLVRFMVSLNQAPGMAERIGVISPLKGGTPRDRVAPPLQSALDMIEGADGIFGERVRELLIGWTLEAMLPGLARLLRGESTPAEFCAALDAGIAEAVAAPDRIIPSHQPYDPARYGEGASQ
jgi:ABC-type glycerol-3-phosphate transport system substrate-binding protein